MPPMFILDVKPFLNVLVVTDPFIADQVVLSSPEYPYGAHKSWTAHDLWPITGKQSMLTLNGEEWRQTRKRFAPGFQPSHLKNVMLPMFVEQAKHFLNNMKKKFESGEVFELAPLCQNFTLDVIGLMVLNKDFHTQTLPENDGMRAPGGLLWAFDIIQSGAHARTNWLEYIDVAGYYRKWNAGRIMDKQYQHLITEALEAADNDTSSRSILSLSVKKQELTSNVLEHASHQLRTFLFAGYDTTASSIAWTFYYLGRPESQHSLDAILHELDEALGPDDQEAERRLADDVHLPLLWNAMREAMRMQPAAASSRAVLPSENDFFVTDKDGSKHKINDTIIFISHRLMHTNPRIWGSKASGCKYDSYEFHPERWADKEYMDTIPAHSYRPFEHGSRDCIGQEVAKTEMKVVLALTLRKWRFEKVTREEDKDEELGEVWGKYNILTVPSDGMRGIVKRRGL